MYPLEMNPLMRELCSYYGQLWRKHYYGGFGLADVEIAKAFLQSAAEHEWARLVKTELGELVWEATPKIFRDIGGLDALRFPRQSPGDEEVKECAEDGQIQIHKTKRLVRDLDGIADLLMYHADNLQEALEVLSALRQLAFHLLAAIGEDPFKGFRPKQREIPQPPPIE